MSKNSIRFLILNLTALAAFGIYEAKRKVVIIPPVYVYVKVPASGMKMSEYESGCLSSLIKAGSINAEFHRRLQEKSGEDSR